MRELKLIENFIAVCNKTETLGSPPKFIEKSNNLHSEDLSGELLIYFQHIELEEECYFGNEYFCLVLLPFDSKRTTIEHWALQDVKEFVRQDYKIFACTNIDEIIFSDIKNAKSPVYGGRTGDPNFYKLSESLSEFLKFYTELTELQLASQFKNDFEFFEKAEVLIEEYISESAQESCKEFILC